MTSPAARLEEAGVTGVLYMAVRTAGECRIDALRLPTLEQEAVVDVVACLFDVSGRGDVAGGWRCPRTPIEVQRDSLVSGWRGCAPAWKPNNELTFVVRGDVVRATDEACPACLQVVLANRDLQRKLRRFRHPSSSRPLAIREIAWLTNSRFAAIVRRPPRGDLLAAFEGNRLVSPPAFGIFSRLYVDRRMQRTYVRHDRQRFDVFDRGGGVIPGESVPFESEAAAVTTSPDARWIAVARPGNVCIYRRDGGVAIPCIRGDAVDLAWRAGER